MPKPVNSHRVQTIPIRQLFSLIDVSTWRKMGFFAIVSVLTSGIPATAEGFVRKFASDAFTLGFDDLFAQTAPLIWSVAMVAFACHRGWLDEGGLIPSAALILFGGWLGHFFQHGGAVTAVDWLPTDRYAALGAVVFAAVNLMVAYLLSYGTAAFIASILVGSAIGAGWSKWLYSLQQQFAAESVGAVNKLQADSETVQRKAA